MTLAMLVTLMTITVLAFLVTAHSFYFRQRLPMMNRMMCSMALSMMISLLIGTILGTMYGGRLLTSMVWSVWVGLGIGLISGWSIGEWAVMDGMLSGLMGGVMGAMTGAMLPISKAEVLIQVLFITYVGIAILLINMIKKQVHQEGWLLRRPFFIIILMAAFFWGYHALGPLGIPKEAKNFGPYQSMGSVRTSKIIVVTATEFSYDPKIIRIQQGKPVTLILRNAGKKEHDLEIRGLPEGKIHIHAQPGNSESVTFVPKQEGTYPFFCTLRGHKERGMVGKLVVQ